MAYKVYILMVFKILEISHTSPPRPNIFQIDDKGSLRKTKQSKVILYGGLAEDIAILLSVTSNGLFDLNKVRVSTKQIIWGKVSRRKFCAKAVI